MVKRSNLALFLVYRHAPAHMLAPVSRTDSLDLVKHDIGYPRPQLQLHRKITQILRPKRQRPFISRVALLVISSSPTRNNVPRG